MIMFTRTGTCIWTQMDDPRTEQWCGGIKKTKPRWLMSRMKQKSSLARGQMC